MNALLGTLLISCIFSSCARTPDHIKAARKSTKHFNERVEKAYGLHSIRFGGNFAQRIREVHLDYEFAQAVDIDHARTLIELCINGVQDQLNKDKEVRPYLYNYPFTPNQLSISIAFVVPGYHKFIPGAKVAQVEFTDGLITYYRYNTTTDKLEAFYQERPG